MTYSIITTEKFDKAFKKLDRQTQKIIQSWIDKNLVNCENPRIHGKGLTSEKTGYWRYRVGKYRILADIRDNILILVLIDIGHRDKIYKEEITQSRHK
ncbi:MAG TPA: type II toxin-antitoxin system RelE/ParE family toxin [Clostridia bacterium]|jgi:mRNA interferase RelE/StbE|nr:type II toxin-antitoxin system RelE/ParE family toxin [Clostridiaceae bacterium]HOF26453.1 type II toxin-antitoxin system RelE/ParE family toxin [Clostridia bacterium]HOM34087.1 type II toxin-antitoxin system RelE/ParE family toxin [Clostridia bacterium]HOR89666.1 type II toxin-antitoxin system RelE/ParE family toxin [Clostridia bacterium]HOT71174.1 type II toxin-antitoxin system RelE/ParE family toxin [Clostridia bacterium]